MVFGILAFLAVGIAAYALLQSPFNCEGASIFQLSYSGCSLKLRKKENP